MAKKSCKKGYYWCRTDEKCKKIPKGWHVMPTGYLMRDNEHKDEEKEETKKKNGNGTNGNGNGNGDSSGSTDGGGVSEGWSAKYKRSIDCDNPKGFSQRAHCQGRKKVNEAKGHEEDHEVSMAQSQLKKSEKNIAKLRKALGKKERNIPAWVQAKITDTEHNTDAAAGYMDEGKRDGKSAKDKGYSLRDWFKGGGWVQAGGKYDGKPCAKQPGQKTKPFCRDADDRASMSKKERSRRAAKKRREDPNPNREGKAKMVTASYSNWRADLEQLDEIAPALAAGAALGIGAGGMYIINKLRQQKKKSDQGQGDGGLVDRLNQRKKMLQQLGNSFTPEGDMVDEANIGFSNPAIKGKPVPYPKGHPKEGKPMSFNKAETEGKQKYDDYYRKTGKRIPADQPLPEEKIVEGKKDACYHKVKSRYSVWPSAYASGALVKCRKVGAKNWGNKTKKESYEFSNWRDDFKPTEYESVDIIKTEPLQPTKGIGSDMVEAKSKAERLKEISKQLSGASKMHAQQSKKVAQVADNLEEAKKCWKGYKKAGTQKLFGKTYNRCVKAHFSDWRADMDLQEKESKPDYLDFDGDGNKEESMKKALKDKKKVKKEEVEIQEAIPGYEKYDAAMKAIRKKNLSGRKLIDALKGATVLRPKTEKEEMGEDWQKVNKKDKTDGMSQKAVNAYRRENPGSKLKTAVTEKNPGGKRAKRRKSFCARSNGQRKMHNIDCSKTPDKAICKARKRWRC